MKQAQVTVTAPQLGLIAATRGMLGAGAALLMADKLPARTRNAIGWTLFLAGAISTIPLARHVLGKLQESDEESRMPVCIGDYEFAADEL